MSTPLEDLFTVLRFPSVSTDSSRRDDTRACANWLVEKLGRMGLKTELHETSGHPVVVAQNEHRPDRRTVLIYGHYDVQPAEPLSEWRTPAFEPTLVGDRILCRGAADNKGQFMAHVCGVEQALREHGDLPVNLTFLIEGEEEIGSPNLKPFLLANKELLKCDVVAISDTGMVAQGKGTFTYGLRGIACVEVTVRGPGIDLHSGLFGGAVANPNMALARILSTFHDPEGRVSVEGFYDDVRPLADWERESWATLGDSAAETQKLTGVPELFGEAGYSDMERRWARPTAEINGIGGGYQGEGSKTVIPRSAFAKFSFRLVPDQSPDDILAKVEAHLRKHTPPGVSLEIELGHTGQPYLMDPFSPFGKAAQNALEATFGGKPALIREGGSIPIVQAFRDVLGVDTLLLGLALPDCQAHAPNENYPVANFEAGIRLNQHLLRELAK
ncbi:dipeptidase [Verrucomicrobium spinosum]|uniref:dipeptidase n=1 Tax=Verrucomicrobium spinosum TaxID=2736 RepID=UPI0001744330|nr:dipeptidase [Verrucomicrobium spinosum]